VQVIRRNLVAFIALFFALAGTGVAASHYLITSTSQIKPSVLRALRAPAASQAATKAPKTAVKRYANRITVASGAPTTLILEVPGVAKIATAECKGATNSYSLTNTGVAGAELLAIQDNITVTQVSWTGYQSLSDYPEAHITVSSGTGATSLIGQITIYARSTESPAACDYVATAQVYKN
jgi:hypothetical protein